MKIRIKRLIVIFVILLASFLTVSCNFASCERCRKDCASEVNGGVDRIIRVYNYQGELIAEYEGKIDVEDNSGTYCLFHVNGKRYMYYNATIEIIEK